MRNCSVQGCQTKAHGYGTLCNSHLKNQRRWGHALQRPFTRSELAKAAARVKELLDRKDNAAEVWASLEALATGLRQDADATLKSHREGHIARGSEVKAAATLAAVLSEADLRDTIAHAVAIGFIAEAEPGRFISDDGLFFTAARRFQSLAKSQRLGSFNCRTGKRSVTLRDLTPRASRRLGGQLMTVFGVLGAMLCRTERKNREEEERRKGFLFTALGGVQAHD